MNTLLYGLQSSAQCLESEWVWVGERTKQTFSTLESSTTPEHLQMLEAEKPCENMNNMLALMDKYWCRLVHQIKH